MRLPMSPTDSMFLLGETRDRPMHVGGLILLQPRDGTTAADLSARFTDSVRDDHVVPAGPSVALALR